MFKYLLSIACGFFFSSSLVLAQTPATESVAKQKQTELFDKQNPNQLIEQVSNKIFERFRQDDQLIAQDINHLKTIITEDLMPYVHHKYSAAKVLGKNRQKLTKQEFNEFTEVFRDYLVLTFANVFTLYDKQKVIFTKNKKPTKGRITSVKIAIIDENRPPIKIIFKMVKSRKTGNWHAFDMIAEGVSMVASKQGEFNAVIRKHGIKHLVTQLQEKSKKSVEQKVIK